jgi:transposase
MRILQKHHIVDLFVWVDDTLPKELSYTASRGAVGRPAMLSVSETITIMLFCGLTAHQRLLKDVWRWSITNHSGDFKIPCYSKFVESCHKAIPHLAYLLKRTLAADAPVKILDSTMLPVCKKCRADRHKVAKEVAAWGKNHQGWHYGFKMHAACDLEGRLSSVFFTPANFHDAQAIPKLVNEQTKIGIGDGGYNARVMREQIWERLGCFILAPPHPKQDKKVIASWQHFLLRIRPKIECIFDYLKEHLQMVTSFPRSVNGYLLNYLRNLLSYQIMVRSGLI